jgi:hypothetical protein
VLDRIEYCSRIRRKEAALAAVPHYRSRLMAEQVLLTTTEPRLLPDSALEGAARWHVQAGHITPDA